MDLDCLSISGARGTGKSSLCRGLISLRQVSRAFIFDPLDEYPADATARTEDELAKLAEAWTEDTAEIVRYVPEVPDGIDPEDMAEEEGRQAGILAQWAMSLGNTVLVVDEAHDACGRHSCSPQMLRAVKRGRHWGVFVWTISQRPTDIHPSIRAELNAQEAWYLRLAENRDLDALAARRGKEFAARVATLDQLHALRLDPLEQTPEEWVILFRKSGDMPPVLQQIS
jgi:hypothetical protein